LNHPGSKLTVLKGALIRNRKADRKVDGSLAIQLGSAYRVDTVGTNKRCCRQSGPTIGPEIESKRACNGGQMRHSTVSRNSLTVSIFVLVFLSAAVSAQSFEQVLYTFTNPPSCSSPSAPLIADGAGNLYGTTFGGGASGKYGCVFELSPSGGGGWNETVLYNFSGSDGAYPLAALVFDKVGDLYGTTEAGGGLRCRGRLRA
jgi:hypothetical protein